MVRLFDPTGIKPDDYRHRYPELERTSEFTNLNVRALLFVWWYANPTSELVKEYPDTYERVQAALERSKYNPSKAERENILRCQFDTEMAAAIKKMSSYDPGARFRGYMMIKSIFDHYETIIREGPNKFITTEGKGENRVDTVDYPKYVTTSAKIAEEIPGLLSKLEEGFGVLDSKGDTVDSAEESSALHDWHRNKDSN